MKKSAISLAVAGLMGATFVSAAETSSADLLEMIRKQEAQIKALKEQIEETNEVVEESINSLESENGNAKTHVGAYGEMHYANIGDEKSLDFHRFVLFFSHQFSDTIRFNSELETEHSVAADGADGAVELEQAYVEMDISTESQIRAGMLLVPVGILNETHEPPVFYGIERNPVEKDILPTTWAEGGAMFSTRTENGLTFDFAVHSGLDVPTDSFKIRKGRQKVAEASANNLAYTTRVKYTGIPGLELAASVQVQDDVTQGAFGAGATLFTTHAVYNKGNFGLRALYASWDIDGPEAEALGADEQTGFYIEPSYRINEKLGVFARYNAWDNNAGNDADTEKKQTNVGFSYWPHQNVVFKFDLEKRSGAFDGDGFNIGVGYSF